MSKIALLLASVGMIGFGGVAFAGPTSDQSAAESDIVAPAAPVAPDGSSHTQTTGPAASVLNPAGASNGLAQSRILGAQQQQQGE